MLDTNMVSYILRGRSPAAVQNLLSLRTHGVACVSAITEGELRYGLAKKPGATALATLVNDFLASIRVLPWSRDEAAVYGTARAQLEAKGISLGNLDMLIAIHAMAVGATLVTNDKAMAQMSDLCPVVNWATDL